jgi:hypothetical protein
MSQQPERVVSTISPERVKEFIETLDKLAYQKPAGFAAYMATCQSSMKIVDFGEQEAKKPK